MKRQKEEYDEMPLCPLLERLRRAREEIHLISALSTDLKDFYDRNIHLKSYAHIDRQMRLGYYSAK